MSQHRSGGARDLVITCIKGEGKFLKFWALPLTGLDTVKSFESRFQILKPDLDASRGFSISEQIPIGFKCVVKSNNKPGRWVRAGVLAHQSYNAIVVRLLDYGSDEVVLVSDVRNIDDPIMSIQPQAIECILADVMPVHNEWSIEAIKFCEQHLLYNTLSCYVVSEYMKLPVVRVAKKGETEAFVQRLINGGLALIKRETVSPPTVQLSYKMNTIEPNTKHLVRVSCFENVQKFYVQLAPAEPELTRLMDAINKSAKDSYAPIKVPAINTPCLAQLSSNPKTCYYRALITYIQQSQCKVFFVDYGFSEQKDIHELRAIPPTFVNLAAQAICCSLPKEADIDPEEFKRLVGVKYLELLVISRTNESYVVKLFFQGQDLLMSTPKAAQNYIQQKLNINSKCEVTVSYVNDVSEFYCQPTNTKDQLNAISNKLNTGYKFSPIFLNECTPGKPVCAKFSEDNLWYRACILKVNHENDIEVFFVDFGNYDNINLSDVRKIGPDLLQYPIQAFKCFLYETPLPTDSSARDDAFELLEELTSGETLFAHINTFAEDTGYGITLYMKNSRLTVNEKILALSLSIPVVPVNDIEDVYVTSFDSCESFFVQFEKIDSEKLAIMQEEINTFYTGMQNNSFVPKEGSLVCARFHEDEQYYRARVEKHKDGQCDVFFIDYGNRESIPVRDVHVIDAKFTQHPQFGTECAFVNFTPRVSNDKISEIMLENSFQMKMVRKEEEKWFVTPVENFPGNAALLNLAKQFERFSGSTRQDDKFRGSQEKRFDSQPCRSNSWNDNTCPPSKLPNKNEVVNYHHGENPKQESFKIPEPAPEFEDYSLISIPPKACRNIYVSHIVSPGEFYCQIEEDCTKLQLLMKNIEDIYAVDTGKLDLSNFVVDTPCCAVYEDGIWYRGKIKNVGNDTCDIFFVDYGNTDSVPKSKIKKLKNDLLRWPSQAVCCKAFNISPKFQDWNDEEINAFIEKALDKSFIAQFVECDSNNCYAVNLFSIDNLANNIFNKEFVDLGYGRLQDSNTSIIMNPRSASTNLSFNAPEVKIGSSEPVQVFYGLNPGEIFCQIKSYEHEFKQMMIKMQNYYKNVSEAESLIDRPHQGMICAAQFSLDSAWYRAEITKVETNKLIVFYVDYGNSEKVDRKKVRCIIQEYAILPVQAIKCRIRGIKPPGKSWTISNNLGKYFEADSICKFISKEEDAYLVDITCNGKDVARSLISDRVAASDGSTVQTEGPKTVQAEVPKMNEKASPELDSRIVQKLAERKDKFTQGQLLSVTVSFIESPLKFWCQLLDESDILNEIVEKIENEVTEYPSLSSSSLKIGSYCIAQYSEDEVWYRAQIVSCETGDTYKVFFIDYGNTEAVSLAQMKKMTPELIQQPPFCFECCLYNAPSKLLPEMTTLFSDTIDGVEEITAKIESVRSGICTVTLLFDKDDQEINVNELLFGVKESAVESGDTCYEFPRFLPPDVPLGLHDGYVSVVKSPQDFYIQLSGTEDPLADLSEELAELSESSANISPSDLCPGYACTTKYSEDDSWYRAEIIEIQDSTVSVLFVDYGNIETVDKSTLKCLNDKHLQMPSQAIKCKLNGIVPVSEEWMDDAIAKFQDMVLDTCLGITFICKDIPATVNIAKDDKDVAQCLVDMELANFESCTEADEAYAEDHLAPAPIEDPLSSLTNDQTYPERKLHSLKHTVKVCYVDSYDKFYVTPLELSTELDTVSATLEILYESPDSTESEECKSTITDVLEDPKISMPCVAKYSEDNKWYRAIITDIAEENIFVTFIDYGNSEIIDLANLRPLAPELLKIPPIALQCSLFGIVAKPGKEQEIADRLEKYFLDDIDLEMEIIEFSPYKIKLFLASDDIASMLIKEGFAEEQFVETETFVGESLEYRIQISKRFFSGADRIIGNVKFCEIENDLIVFHVVSTDLEDDLQDLQQKLQDAYCEPSQNLANVSCMDFCATKYMEDENWYRAQVLSVEKDKIKVRFIDYGNCETVDKSNIYELLGDFTIEPQFSVKCILFGLKVDKSKEIELQNKLDEYVYHEPVELKLCKHSHAVCDLCITSVVCGNTDITELICDEKLVFPQYVINSQLDSVFRATVQKIEADVVFLLPLSVIDEREAFQCKLQNVCKDIEKLTKPQVDHLCAAKVDDVWFRVSVMNISESEVTVDLVDFGLIKVTDIFEFVPLPLDICHQPIFLQPCVVHVTEDSGNAKTISIKDLSIGSEISCELQKIYRSVQPLSVKIIEIHSSLNETETENDEVHIENETANVSEILNNNVTLLLAGPVVESEKEYSQNEKEIEDYKINEVDIENEKAVDDSESLAIDNKSSELELNEDSEKEMYFSENENETENGKLDQVNNENDELDQINVENVTAINEELDQANVEYDTTINEELDQVNVENDTTIKEEQDQVNVENDTAFNDALNQVNIENDIAINDELDQVNVENDTCFNDELNQVNVENDTCFNDELDQVNVEDGELDQVSVENDTAINDELDQVNVENDTCFNDELNQVNVENDTCFNDELDQVNVEDGELDQVSVENDTAINDELDQVNVENDAAINDSLSFNDDIKVSESIVTSKEYFTQDENEMKNEELNKVNSENDSGSFISDVKLSGNEFNEGFKMEDYVSDNVNENECLKIEMEKTPVKDTNFAELSETISDGHKVHKSTSETGEHESFVEKTDIININECHESFEENKQEKSEIESCESDHTHDETLLKHELDVNKVVEEASFHNTEDEAGLFDKNNDIFDDKTIKMDTDNLHDPEFTESSVAVENKDTTTFKKDYKGEEEHSTEKANVFEGTDIIQESTSADSAKQQNEIQEEIFESASDVTSTDCHSPKNISRELNISVKENNFDGESNNKSDMECDNLLTTSENLNEHIKEKVPHEDKYFESEDKTSENNSMFDQNTFDEQITDNQNLIDDHDADDLKDASPSKHDEEEISNLNYYCDGSDMELEENVVNTFEDTEPKENNRIIQDSIQLTGLVPVKVSDITISDGSVIFAVQPLYLQDEFSHLKKSIQEFYSSKAVPYDVNADSQYCAVFHDGEWSRGKILQSGCSTILLILIDYGKCVSVDSSNIKKLDEEHSNVPPFAVWCTLFSATCPPEKNEATKTFLFDKLKDDEAVVKILEGIEPYKISMFVKGESILNQLLRNNLVMQKLPNMYLEPGSHKSKLSFINITLGSVEIFVNLLSFSDDYNTLFEDMQSAYKVDDFVSNIVKSGIYAIFYNDSWYRGLVVSANDEVQVFLVDTGETVTGCKNLCFLLPEHCFQPSLAIPCHIPLSDIQATNEIFESINGILKAAEFLVNIKLCPETNSLSATLIDEQIMSEVKNIGLTRVPADSESVGVKTTDNVDIPVSNYVEVSCSDSPLTTTSTVEKHDIPNSVEIKSSSLTADSSAAGGDAQKPEQFVSYIEETFTAEP